MHGNSRTGRRAVTSPRLLVCTIASAAALGAAIVALPLLLMPPLPDAVQSVAVRESSAAPAPPAVQEAHYIGDADADATELAPSRDLTTAATEPNERDTEDDGTPSAAAASPEAPGVPAVTGQLEPAASPDSASEAHEDPFDRSPEARRRRAERFGGTVNTENAVEAGLVWLAAHQETDGTWDRFGFPSRCPRGDMCPGIAVQRKEDDLTAGISGLALLAFLGCGYSDRQGPHAEVVGRAVSGLIRLQTAEGDFSVSESMAGYNNSVATLALAEFYALTRDERVRAPLERAVRRLVLTQQPLGGWDYLATPESGRNDTSITAWAIQALQAAAVGGVDVPPRALIRCALHLSRAAQSDGRVWYSDAGTGFSIGPDGRPRFRFGPSMIAAGLACEQMLGWSTQSELVRRQQALLLADPPSAARLRGGDQTEAHDYYYWYYGTAAMFQSGPTTWQRWNAALRDALLPLQERERRDAGTPHRFGSWAPFGARWGKWGRIGGRVYATAICALTLEIYYRHIPAYLEDRTLIQPADWRAFLAGASPRERRESVRCLGALRCELSEPVLIDLLGAPEADVVFAAAESLTDLGSPIAKATIESGLARGAPWSQALAAALLKRIDDITALPPVEGRIRMFDAASRLATVDLARSYVGMELAIVRDGQTMTRLTVVRRWQGSNVALAESSEGGLPRSGDAVVSR
jgi:hypothetical protein